jgi:hypothetical protein
MKSHGMEAACSSVDHVLASSLVAAVAAKASAGNKSGSTSAAEAMRQSPM